MSTCRRFSLACMALPALLLSLTGCGQAPVPPPDAVVTQVAKGITQRDPKMIWDGLPVSYQVDVDNLMHSFAAKVDEKVWNRGVQVARKAVVVLRDKKEFVLNAPGMARSLRGLPMPPQALAKHADKLASLAEAILAGGWTDLNKLKTYSVGQLLAESGGPVMKQALAFLEATIPGYAAQIERVGQIKAETVKQEPLTATVKITFPDGPTAEKPRHEFFKRVQDKWVPQSMAEEWADQVTRWRNTLDKQAPASLFGDPAPTLALLDKMETVLDKMAAAQTQEEFNAQWSKEIPAKARPAGHPPLE